MQRGHSDHRRMPAQGAPGVCGCTSQCIYHPQVYSRLMSLYKGTRSQENTPLNQGFNVSGDECQNGKPTCR